MIVTVTRDKIPSQSEP